MTEVITISLDRRLRYHMERYYVRDQYRHTRFRITIIFNLSNGGGQLVETFIYNVPGSEDAPILL
jgi:hypothetical protein